VSDRQSPDSIGTRAGPAAPIDSDSDYIDSHYSATLGVVPRYAPLEGEHRADVAIVGGGLSGIATALGLAERGVKVAVLEAHRIGWGATGRNGGQVTGSLSGDVAMQRQLTRTLGAAAATAFVQHLRWRGHALIEDRIARYQIDCERQHGHLHAAWSAAHIPALHAAIDDARAAGLTENEVRWLSRDEVHARLETPLYHGGVLNTRNLHLHPLKLCHGEARAAVANGASLYEQSAVIRIDSGRQPCVHTRSGRVRADAILLAGNAYHRLERRRLAGKLLPAVLGNLVTEKLDQATLDELNPERLAVYDSRVVLDYYRPTADGRLMFGGGTNYSGREIPEIASTLRPALERTFPRLAGVGIERAWSGTAGIVVNRIPIVRRLDNGVHVAQGYSGHGLATTHVVSEIMVDALSGRQSDLFDAFQSFHHWRLPMGNALMALGMAWYRLRDRQ